MHHRRREPKQSLSRGELDTAIGIIERFDQHARPAALAASAGDFGTFTQGAGHAERDRGSFISQRPIQRVDERAGVNGGQEIVHVGSRLGERLFEPAALQCLVHGQADKRGLCRFVGRIEFKRPAGIAQSEILFGL